MDQDQWSEGIGFGAICDFFEKTLCKPRANKEKKLRKLENFFSTCRKNCPKECDLFPVLRLLVPKLDQERGSYSIKETVFAKVRMHSGPEKLKKSRQKNSWNRRPVKSNKSFLFREIAFLAVFPVQK